MFVLGLDVGYSNLKTAAGTAGGAPRSLVRPAGAAPADRLGERIDTGARAAASADAPILVDVDGEPWAAGIEPGRFEGWQRPLHEDYAGTPTYRALAKAAFLLSGQRAIDTVVAGLPVAQAGDARRRDALKRVLEGRHFAPEGDIEVGEAKVVAQPVGAYLDLLWSARDEEVLERIEHGAVLVLDAGYYSVDWALLVRGELRRTASGTSLEAMSVLLERASRRAAEEAGGKAEPLELEAAVRTGRAHVLQAGRRIAVRPLLAQVAGPVARAALESMRQALRRETRSVDLVLVAGGGGALYGAAVAELFPGALAAVPPDPVGANARGFFRYAD